MSVNSFVRVLMLAALAVVIDLAADEALQEMPVAYE
jgi:hypothetical protein